ncbi:Urease accessory protein UreD [Novosphingobium nitrogenifigens DSM 19370]|uniref:Urease accessory protein UreD n=1 Tax=Novosphingobium nitrogenifigens DSM 19370 TaxID=983920 RepID=F1Z7W6_9SPHN|nr:urease accessory protein UreD [Novosphingobium nitrogenifigens]EGD59259.1 Urease accessory protein UreD [Novosphingobium nitrogenifigens DSM 19370]
MSFLDRASSAPSFPRFSETALRHQRVDGHARLRFGPNGLADLYQRAPCRVLFPAVPTGAFPLAVMLTTSGGLTGGDRIALDIAVDEGACASVMGQAAEKLYRVGPGEAPASIVTRIDIADGARAEWLAQEAILFDAARLDRRTEIALSGSARLLAVESLVFGRIAMGERMTTGLIRDAWRIRRDGRLVWADGFVMEDDIAGLCAAPWGLGDAVAMASAIYAGPDAAAHLPLAREVIELATGDGAEGGATLVNGILLLRLLDSDAARLRRRLSHLLSVLREAALGLSTPLPAVWTH